MPRYRLTIAYDGTLFHGWQKQEPPDPGAPAVAAGVEPARIEMRTVQGVVERAVREVVRERVILLGASRTDAGVHARGQVAAFTCSDLPLEPAPGYAGEPDRISGARAPDEPNSQGEGRGASRLRREHGLQGRATKGRGWPSDRGTEPMLRAINSRLPEDVLVVAAAEASRDFDPIGDAVTKCYSYTFHVSKHRPLWDRNLVHHLWTPHDVRLMEIAAHHFVGEHDFAGFAAAGHGRLTTVRTVHACRVARLDAGDDADPGAYRIRMEIEGSGFLYNMVRIIAGTLADVGRGRIEAAQVPWIIKSLDRRRAGPTMPASGLCLEWIRYPGE